MGGYFHWRPHQPKYWVGCVPGIRGGVDGSVLVYKWSAWLQNRRRSTELRSIINVLRRSNPDVTHVVAENLIRNKKEMKMKNKRKTYRNDVLNDVLELLTAHTTFTVRIFMMHVQHIGVKNGFYVFFLF